MTLNEKLKVLRTQDRRAFTPQPSVSFDSVDTHDIEHTLQSVQERYVLELRIAVDFWANKAQRESAERIARRVIADAIYRDCAALVNRAMLSVSNGNDDEAMLYLSDLLNEMKAD